MKFSENFESVISRQFHINHIDHDNCGLLDFQEYFGQKFRRRDFREFCNLLLKLQIAFKEAFIFDIHNIREVYNL